MKVNLPSKNSSIEAMSLNVWKTLKPEKQKEIEMHIYKDRCAEIAEQIAINNDAVIFITLCEEFGFTKRKCKKLFDLVDARRKAFVQRVEVISGREQNEISADDLKRYYGVDVEKWRKLKDKWNAKEDEVWQAHEKSHRISK